MAFFDSKQQRATALILVLGVGVAIALWPYTTGLIGAPVLYIVFAPLHRWLSRVMKPSIAAAVCIAIALLMVLGPGVSLVTLLATEAPQMAERLIASPLVGRISQLEVGPYNVGEQIARFGEQAVTFVGASALGFIGTAARLSIQLTITAFGLFYLLLNPQSIWRAVRPFIPFSATNTEVLRKRFRDVTVSTLVGTFACAIVQGALVGAGFAVTGLANPFFWGVLTALFSILPVVGSGLIWVPGVAALAIDGRFGMAIGLAVYCILIVSNVDNVIRPWVSRRYAQLHPFVTVIGAFAGIQYFGLLGLLIGPLAISYFFELIRMYRQEYLSDETTGEVVLPPRSAAPPHEALMTEGGV